jgi:signal transduction histidine kinase
VKKPPADPSRSQHALAASIAREVQSTLPQQYSLTGLTESVESALVTEAHQNELLLAYTRAGVLAAYSVIYALSYGTADAFIIIIWALVAFAFPLVLNRGWYRTWLRHAVAVSDALLILTSALLLYRHAQVSGETLESGHIGILATACVFLAFSGAFRLSRTTARLTTVLGLAAWVITAMLGEVDLLQALFIGGIVIATGLFGSRITHIIRRVVAKEVAQGRLTVLYDDAQHAVHAREEVLKIVAHDLRNPLNTIGMAAELLMEGTKDPQQLKNLEIIRRTAKRMNRLIHDLLDVARMEAGRVVLEQKPVDVPVLFADVLEMMRPIAAQSSLQIETTGQNDVPPIHVDPDRTLQIFSNLVGNAIKFTPAGGTIVLKASRVGPKVRLAVSDDGQGIPADQLPNIFGRFWQGNKADRRGIGMGLTIARSLVEAHGEQIGVESRFGEGTEFWFTAAIAEKK